MTLPDLVLQTVYGRVAWALVLAALACMLAPRLAQRFRAAVVVSAVVLMVLPGAASPAYWLTLAFAFPSGLLVGCSLVTLYANWRGSRAALQLRPAFALPLFVAGTLLYLDTFGVLALGLYHAGFGGTGMPLLALLAMVACAAAIVRGRSGTAPLAALAGLLLYALVRLPTGNLWDAVLDPLLWAWAVVSLVMAAVRAARRADGSVRTEAPAPVSVSATEPEAVPVHAAGIE
ncbi:hypothetical protein IP91_03573 [Pseudoduganella lurida]|uniref:Uncharacterized protein n=1 Tax=Pseudoduganella lurida TaxID=1036180 RepID=A0A562R3E3_9BURK|nr:hypothetical protein [Pseudoduganella lurida]TWI63602.1 hypothetical protein IP91_03573 [Pseudoduganella lurida]